MVKNSRTLRISQIAHNNLIMKKKRMEETLSQLTRRKNTKIPLTRIIENLSKQPVYLSDDELKQLFGKGRRRIC